MSRVMLIHWNADEADARAAVLRGAGYDVACHTDARAQPKPLREDPPDAFVIDLRRLPAQGREIGGWLRRQSATRFVPLVFIEGDPSKTARVRDLLPDAAYTAWENVVPTLASAIASPPDRPHVPGAMDAYRDVPLTKRLGIRADSSVTVISPPANIETTLGPLPTGASLALHAATACDTVLWFVRSTAALEQGLSDAASQLAAGGRLWILWPKVRAAMRSDLSQTIVRAFGLERGFVDYKIVAFDDTWSGLCFRRRA